jgi:large subunit ribosomal protein L31
MSTGTDKQTKAKTTNNKKSALNGINPKQHKIKVLNTDGSSFEILTTWGKEGQVLHLDLSPINHPAWQDKSSQVVNSKDAQVSKFKEKFGDFDF